MSKSFFVTGTDTGVGKTLVTAALLHAAAQRGLRSLGLKPLAAGCEATEAGLRNADAQLLQRYSSVALPYAQVNPVALKEPLAPHIAALRERRLINLERLEGVSRGALMTPADLRLIEGAGGWRVPLNPMQLYSDLPARLNTPVILVVGMRLGCLNHALLTAEAIRADGVALAGWVANELDDGMAALDDNVETLQALLPAPLIGRIPRQSPVDVSATAEYLSLGPLGLAQ